MFNQPDFWNSWKGQIIKAIVLQGAYTKSEIMEITGLTETQFETARNESINAGILKELDDSAKLWVNSPQLCNEYRDFFAKLQDSIIEWVHKWTIHNNLRGSLNHFFLNGEFLDEISRKLLKSAYLDVLIANPYVEQCNLSESLIVARKKGVRVRLVTRPITNSYNKEKKEKYHSKLQQEGISIIYNDSIHAKLIVIDHAVAIVSSMNFIASSSGGAASEAGIVTLESDTIKSVTHYIHNQF